MKILVIAIVAIVCTYRGIQSVHIPLSGKDLSKKEGAPIPEGIGLISCGITIIACIFAGVSNNILFPITAALLLGFMDDVINIPWRLKLLLPAIASLPLEFETSKIDIGGVFIDFGGMYPIFATLLCVYCSNAINILAGINGIEVGQSIIIAISFMCMDHHTWPLMMPFVSTSAVLCWFNWYPARVFVGDSYTLFSGMLFAVTGLVFHLNYTLFWMLLPQTFNFCVSLPQLLKIQECPRHRLPAYNVETDRLEPSEYKGRMNKTLLNYVLKACGPMHERTLATLVMSIQAATCLFAYCLRM